MCAHVCGARLVSGSQRFAAAVYIFAQMQIILTAANELADACCRSCIMSVPWRPSIIQPPGICSTTL